MYRATLPGFKTHIAKQSVRGGPASALLTKTWGAATGADSEDVDTKLLQWGKPRAKRYAVFLCAASHMQMVGPNALNDRAHCAG